MTTTARITIYPPEALKERLDEIAARERRSLNAQVLVMLEDAVEREESPATVRTVDPLQLRPGPRKARTSTCEHRIAADQFCKVCDG